MSAEAIKIDDNFVEMTLFDGNVNKVVRTEFLPGAFENMEVFKPSMSVRNKEHSDELTEFYSKSSNDGAI